MKLTKGNLINYLVDVLGNSEEEAKTISREYGTTYLTSEQMTECIAFNS